MTLIRSTMPRARAKFIGQIGTSVAATVAATLIVSAIQHEIGGLRSAVPSPELTTGGKFAARVSALRAEADTSDLPLVAPPRVPLMAMNAPLGILPVTTVPTPASAAAAKPSTPDAFKPVKRVARSDAHRKVVADAVDVLPPRRVEGAVPVAAPPSGAIEAVSSSMWSTTKDLYKQAVWLGTSAFDRVNPLNLLP